MTRQRAAQRRVGECLTDDLIATYVAGHLPDGAAEVLESHIASCRDCRQRVEAHRADETLALAIKDAFGAPGEAATENGPLPGGGEWADVGAVEGYDIRDEIHRGGQGAVYEAIHKATKRTVALKVLLHGGFASDRQRRRFEREIEMVAGLRHPNIVTVFDSAVAGGDRPYLAMEYVDGVPLDHYVEERLAEAGDGEAGRAASREPGFTLPKLLRLFLKVCDAVSYAHQRGVIHRDLKPSNILVDAHGEPHVLDFGLAKALEADLPDGRGSVTLDGEFLGTVAYAAPEQIQGGRPSDVRSDVYSLGVILYRILTGHYPYRVHGPLGDVFNQITSAEPEPPSVWHKRGRRAAGWGGAVRALRVDDDLETIVLGCLQKECDRRYPSVADLARDIEHYLAGEPIVLKRDSAWYVLRKLLYRHRITAMVLAAFLAVVAEAAFVSVIYWYQAVLDAERVAHAEALARERVAGEIATRDNWEVMAAFNADWLRTVGAYDPAAEAVVARVLGVTPAAAALAGFAEEESAAAATQPEAARYASEEAALLRLHELLFALRGPGDERRVRAVRELVRLYEEWGKPQAAAEWRAKLPRAAALPG